MVIPTREECFKLMNQYGMLKNIFDHSMEVRKVALYLAMELNKKGQRIDLRLVEAASLLHDLTKSQSLKTKEDHAQTAYQLLKNMGYERVAEVVAEHIRVQKKNVSTSITEEEIVNYADKRVQHDRIVSLEERFRDLIERYAETLISSKEMNQLKEETYRIEHKIFSILGFDPNEIPLSLFEVDF